jgi:hypothetical protein
MHGLALPLVLCSWLSIHTTTIPNLDFRTGTLAGWEGHGFTVLSRADDDWVSSQDSPGGGRKALLHRAFLVPPEAGVLRFRAYAARGERCPVDDRLDVVLMAAGKRVIPKLVRAPHGWQRVSRLLPAKKNQPQEYIWRIGDYVGQYLRIALIDEDNRPGCHVFCSGFEIIPGDEFERHDFSEFMLRLAEEQQLGPITRYESPHFLALSNAEESFSEMRLGNCELLYTLFWDHFRRKGFTLQSPQTKLMVAMFDSQAGFNAYLGRKESPLIIGMYHPLTNRFVVYDYGQNEIHLSLKSQAERQARQIDSHLDRQRSIEAVQRRAHDFRTGTNISTVMHEVAHQLSFNCGMLNREGDVSFWLSEGLACYCEATNNGSWQGIGAPNPLRCSSLISFLRNKGQLLDLRELVTRDDWMPSRRDDQTTLLAYAQSWALFRMLMEEQPQSVRSYLKEVYSRRNRDCRLQDFQQAFGHDFLGLQRRHKEYILGLIQQSAQPQR